MPQRFKNMISSQRVFLTCWLLLIITLSLALYIVPKHELHLALNASTHTSALDIFFRYFTKIAEYLPYIIVVILLFYNYGWAIVAALGQLGATLTTQTLKHIVNAPRPKTFFSDNYPNLIPQLHWVDGVNMHSWFSFPSGHTTAFFALFFLLSLLLTDHINTKTDKKSISPSVDKLILIQILCFLFAALGGYSRIYLSQHFAADVLAGCIVGVMLTALFYCLPWPWNKPWAYRSILTRKPRPSCE